MARRNRELPDDFESPVPHAAPGKSLIDKVLGGAIQMGSSAVSIMSGMLAAVMILYSGYVLYDTMSTQYNAYSSSWDLLQYKPEIIEDPLTVLEGGDILRGINEDYRGWLTVYDTNIDYPVMQGPNDVYYATHDIYRNPSLTGAIYLAGNNASDFSDNYNVLYGHHMDNGAMFGGLDHFKDQDYFDSHREAIIVSSGGVYDITIFAVISTDAYESKIYSVGNQMDSVIDFLDSGGEGGIGLGTEVLIYDRAAVAGAEKLVALSTCASATTNGRLVVIGRMDRRTLITIEAQGYEGMYDGEAHGISGLTVNITEGTTIQYSIDGGQTWTDEAPTITDVGQTEVTIRARNEENGDAITTVTLTVLPRPVTVTVQDSTKVYGQPDPTFTAVVEGTLDGDVIEYTISRDQADQNVGQYPLTLIPDGEEVQGNYIVTYIEGNFTITPAPMPLVVDGYIGYYDGEEHRAVIKTVPPAGSTMEFSIDGGETWSSIPPSIIDPGSTIVTVRVTNPNYFPAIAEAELIVLPLPETVERTIVAVWDDNDNEDGVRPESVRMVLLGDDGSAVTVTLSEANNWMQTVTDLTDGVTYRWIAPNANGYTMTGNITEGTVTTVTYSRRTTVDPSEEGNIRDYTLTVNYRFLDGRQAAETYQDTLLPGTDYRVVSPIIEGYTAAMIEVSGTMGDRDVTYTVLYIPDQHHIEDPEFPVTPGWTIPTVTIEENGNPLGLQEIFIHVGDCFE